MEDSQWKEGTLKTKNLRITIVSHHVHHKGQWVMHVPQLGWNCKYLNLTSDIPEGVAQEKAVSMVREHLNTLISELKGFSVVLF